MEELDGRIVPSVDTYLGGDPYTASNWSAGHYPTYGDDVYLDGNYSSGDVPLSAIGPLAGIHLVNGYSGTVTLTNHVWVGTLELTSGAISQWNGSFTTNITVSSSLNWTGGTLNSSAYTANLTIAGGATATINPGIGNTISTGDNIEVGSSSTADTLVTIGNGIINFTNESIFEIAAAAPPKTVAVHIEASQGVVWQGNIKQITIRREAVLEVSLGPWMPDKPVFNDGGFLVMKDSGSVRLAGSVSISPTLPVLATTTYYQQGDTGTLQIMSGSTFQVEKQAWITAGSLHTDYNSSLLDTVVAQTATLDGDLLVTGGSVSICTSLGAGTHYGTFRVTKKVSLGNAALVVKVDQTTTGHNDVWQSNGDFAIAPATNPTATLTVLSTTGQAAANAVWVILKSDGVLGGRFTTRNVVYDSGNPPKSYNVSYAFGTEGFIELTP